LPLGGKKINSSNTLKAFVDADFANDSVDYKSITGYMVFYEKSLISWTSKKPKAVTLSSTESEFTALTDDAKEIPGYSQSFSFWVSQTLKDAPLSWKIICH
jgi:hypothetical protein